MKRIAIHTAPPFHPRTCTFRKKAYSPGKGEEMGNIFRCLFQSTRKLRKPGPTMKCELINLIFHLPTLQPRERRIQKNLLQIACLSKEMPRMFKGCKVSTIRYSESQKQEKWRRTKQSLVKIAYPTASLFTEAWDGGCNMTSSGHSSLFIPTFGLIGFQGVKTQGLKDRQIPSRNSTQNRKSQQILE